MKAETVSFTDHEVQQCPFPVYDRLRVEQPVYQDPKTGHFVLTRYDDVRKVLLNPKRFSSKTGLIQTRDVAKVGEVARIYAEEGWSPVDTLVSNDPPTHRHYRTLVDKAFSPARIVALEPRIAEIADELIDGFIDEPEIDFVQRFAVKLPVIMIAEQLGVATEDLERFKFWSDASLEAVNLNLPEDRLIETARAIVEMQQYLAVNVARFRENPDDTKLLSRLVHAEVEGRSLTMQEIMSIVQQLLVAGNETTTAALGSGMKLLIDNPAVVPALRAAPSRIPAFVEETLRIMAPIQTLFRRAVADEEIDGVTIPANSIIEARYGAANRDPEVFAEPECPRIDRANATSHMTFGAGIHLCIGNQLARGELRVAFKHLIARLDNFRLSRGQEGLAYTTFFVSHGLTRLMMAFDRV